LEAENSKQSFLLLQKLFVLTTALISKLLVVGKHAPAAVRFPNINW